METTLTNAELMKKLKMFKDLADDQSARLKVQSEYSRTQDELIKLQSEQIKSQAEHSRSQDELIKLQSEQIKSQAEHSRSQDELIKLQSEQIKSQAEYSERQDEQIKTQDDQIAKMQTLITYYEDQFSLMKRHRFGSSSEKTDPDLRQLNFLGNPADVPVPEPETEEITYKRKKRKGKREEDLSGLPIERIDYELPEEERVCPGCMGEQQTRGLRLRPARSAARPCVTSGLPSGAS